jgi:outer membrane protein OmpA-like peptidoglycan-associated protein
MCQQYYHSHVHTNLTELTRTDDGWPEHRRRLAQKLLTNGRFMALVEYHAPAAPEQAGQWLGCLALVTMATAGQQAKENRLDAKSLQLWLQQQTAAGKGPVESKRAAPSMASPPAPQTATAPWWPLAALAVLGLCASSYFYQQQTAAVNLLAQLPASTAPVLANSLTAIPAVLITASQATTAEDSELGPAAPRTVRFASSSSAPVKAVARHSASGKPAAETAPKTARKASASRSRRPSAEPSLTSLSPQLVHPDATDNKSGYNTSQPPTLISSDAASTESLLYKRLANPDVANRKPIDLDQLSFALGEATLDQAGAKQLGNVANILKTFPHYRLIVFGKAEASEPHSVSLALDRANTVIAELVKQGVPSNALQAQGLLRSSSGSDAEAKRRPALYISSLE